MSGGHHESHSSTFRRNLGPISSGLGMLGLLGWMLLGSLCVLIVAPWEFVKLVFWSWPPWTLVAVASALGSAIVGKRREH